MSALNSIIRYTLEEVQPQEDDVIVDLEEKSTHPITKIVDNLSPPTPKKPNVATRFKRKWECWFDHKRNKGPEWLSKLLFRLYELWAWPDLTDASDVYLQNIKYDIERNH